MLSLYKIWMFVISIALVGALEFFLSRSRYGQAVRAVSQDMLGASQVGINVNQVFGLTFGLSVVLTGLLGIPWMNLFGFQVSPIDKLTWFWLALAIGSICVYAIYFLILRGRMGLAFIAMRDAEDFAQSIGVNEYKYKLLAFFVSATFTGIAGGLYAHYTGVVTPKILGTEFFLMAMVMLSIGGMGRFPGAILGVFIVVVGNETLRVFDEYRLFLLGVAIVITVIFFPRGVVTALKLPSRKT